MIKVGLSIGLLAVIGMGYWFTLPKNAPTQDPIIAVKTLAFEKSDQDTDKDGLKDWEEVLWHTDPNNPDTDKDGTPDGAEVLLNREPSKPGPNDVIKITPATSAQSESSSGAGAYTYNPELGENLTDQVSLNLTSNYLLSKNKGALTEEEKAQLVDSITNDAIGSLSSPKVYVAVSMRTVGSNTESMHNYYNALATIILNSDALSYGTELKIMDAAKKSGDIADFEPLRAIGDEYAVVTKQIFALSVPTILAQTHLAMTNNLSKAGWGLSLMGNAGGDPTTMLLGLRAYQSAYSELVDTIMPTLKLPITSGQITFTSSETARIFMP